ncbi:MAG: AmmeMemoRadiSam system protein B [Patescibacteria group bacterium]|nr:AmmeMemoRadiSam system protein B [Patescibacteria group bacterium]
MIVFGAIIPHSPLLIPSIGKDQREKLKVTIDAISQIEQALYLAKPETIVIIGPHGPRYPDAFSTNMAGSYTGTLKSFGDFSTTISAKSDYMLIDRAHRKMREEDIPFTLTSSEELDYSFTIPILLLTQHLQNWKLIPISPSMMDGKAHYEFGRQIKRVLHMEKRRVAVIASADLSHKLSADSPGGLSKEGQQFDEMIQKTVLLDDPTQLLTMPAEIIENSGQCGYRPICTLLGMFDKMNVARQMLSYEAPFGVGYMTAKFDIA